MKKNTGRTCSRSSPGRGVGVGEAALALEVKYLVGKGAKSLFLETHSKNAPMMKCAEKLGFSLIEREEAKWKAAGEAYDKVARLLGLAVTR